MVCSVRRKQFYMSALTLKTHVFNLTLKNHVFYPMKFGAKIAGIPGDMAREFQCLVEVRVRVRVYHILFGYNTGWNFSACARTRFL